MVFGKLLRIGPLALWENNHVSVSSSQVKFEEGQALAKKLHANFIETSAKDNKNISELPCPSSDIRGLGN